MLRIVADNVESFQVVCEEYFEVGVVGVVMESCVYVVVVCTGIRGVFNFEVFYEDKIFDDLYAFDLPIPAEEISDSVLIGILHATDIKFSDQNALMDMFRRLRLLSQFLFLSLSQFHVLLMDISIEIDGVISDCRSYFMLCLFLFPLLVVSDIGAVVAGLVVVAFVFSVGLVVVVGVGMPGSSLGI